MAYGVNWEWRGFGDIAGETEARILGLRASAVPERAVTDTYLWYPGLGSNVKIRAWEGGGSLKVKRLLDPGNDPGPSLWLESPAEDYDFPLRERALENALAALGVDPRTPHPPTPLSSADFLSWLVDAAGALRIVEVRKRRRSFVWDAGAVPVLVELAEIEHPEPIRSIGVEDMAELAPEAPSERMTVARSSVSEAAAALGGGLSVLTYPQAVAIWARGGSVARLESG
jgi:hypothetical protein